MMHHRSSDALTTVWLESSVRLQQTISPAERDWHEMVLVALERELQERGAKIVWVAGYGFRFQYITNGNCHQPFLPELRQTS